MFHVEHEQLKIQKKCSTGDNVPRGTFFYGILKKEVLYCRKDAKKRYSSQDTHSQKCTFRVNCNKIMLFSRNEDIMGRIIAVANQKGGVGKTTTAINLAASLAEYQKNVLIIDMDPQGNTTSGLGLNKDELDATVYDLMINYTEIWDCISPSVVEGVSVIPSDRDLAGAEIELVGIKEREYILKKEVDKVKDKYDFVIIDCPPSLSMLTINAMTTADTVLVPIQCEYYALEGLTQLLHTINLVKSRLNPDLEMEGVVFTMYDARTNLSLQVVENVKDNLQERVYKTIIPRNVRLAEAPSHGLPINLYDARSTGAEAYHQLAEEVINRE